MSGQAPLDRAVASSPSSEAPARAGRDRADAQAPVRGRPSRRAEAALPLDVVGAGMVLRPIRVRAPDVVFVKGLIEASDGLAAVFAERGGELLLATPHGRELELAELVADLEAELGACQGWNQGP